MKKTVKICAAFIGICIFLFLMLPFLVPSTNVSTSSNDLTTKKTRGLPQIFTDNPLTDLVSRISNFFEGEQKKPSVQRQEVNNSSAPVNLSPEEYLTEAKNKLNKEEDIEPNLQNGSFNLYTQNEEGEWVLIPQTSPEIAEATGMHTGSIKEDVYEKYLQQERTNRIVAKNGKVPLTDEQIPTSTLARLFNPIKEFFGFGNSHPSDIAQNNDERTSGLVASSNDKKKAKNPRSIQRAKEVDMAPHNVSFNLQPEKSTAKYLYSLLDPTSNIEDIATMLTEAKYPEPLSDKQKIDAQNYKAEQFKELATKFDQGYDQMIDKALEGSQVELVDKFPLTRPCANDGLIKQTANEDHCGIPTTEEDSIQYSKGNAESFYEKTHISIEKAKQYVTITPILSMADINLSKDEDNEAYQQWQQKKCQEVGCFWVANENASGVNTTFHAASLETNNNFEKNGDFAYTLYSTQELANMIDKNRKLVESSLNGNKDMPNEKISILWVSDPTQAKNLRAKLKEVNPDKIAPIVLYDKNNHALDSSEEFSSRSEDLANGIADIFVDAKTILNEISQESTGKTIQQHIMNLKDNGNKKVQEIQALIKGQGKTNK